MPTDTTPATLTTLPGVDLTTKTWTTGEVGRMFGCSPSCISRYASIGIIKTTGGRKQPLQLDYVAALTVGLCISLGHKNVPQRDMIRVGKYLSRFSPASLRKKVHETGGRLSFVLGGRPKILGRDAPAQPQLLQGIGVACIIDLQTMMERLDSYIVGEATTK